jgi:hypothetical protein
MRVLGCIGDGCVFLRNTVDHLNRRQRVIAIVALAAIALSSSFLAGTSLLLACYFTASVILGSAYCFFSNPRQSQERSVEQVPVESALVVRERCRATVEGLYTTIDKTDSSRNRYFEFVPGDIKMFFLYGYEQIGECACHACARDVGVPCYVLTGGVPCSEDHRRFTNPRDAFEYDFIRRIYAQFPDRSQKLEITCFGSGRCLQEIILLVKLKRWGYENIKLNIIDTMYQDPESTAVESVERSFDYHKLQAEVGQILGYLREGGRFAVEVNFMDSYKGYIERLRAEELEVPGALMFYDFNVYAPKDTIAAERSGVDLLAAAARDGAGWLSGTKVCMGVYQGATPRDPVIFCGF